MTKLSDAVIMESLFFPGTIFQTPGAEVVLNELGIDPLDLLTRHLTGDFGNIPECDQAENKFSIQNGFRVFSSYQVSSDTKLYVITEADRSATTILLPSEY